MGRSLKEGRVVTSIQQGMSDDEDPTPSWSPEERDRFLKSLLEDDEGKEMPLLAESVDEMDPDLVAALVQLRDGDDEPLELATAAKERGNKHFATATKTKKKMWYKEAAKEYTDGLSLCRAAAETVKDRPKDEDSEALGRLTSVLRSNRAACALALGNYGDAKRDCRDALVADPSNMKALYRLGRACVLLRQWSQAKQTAEWAFSLDPSSPEFKQIAKVANEKLEEAERQRLAHVDFFESFARMDVKIAAPRNRSSDDGPKTPTDWPVVIEYPEANVPFDYVEAVHTDTHLFEWLLHLFPEENCPPWDSSSLYHASNLAAYVKQPRKLDRHLFQNAEAYAEYKTSGSQIGRKVEDEDSDNEDDAVYLEVSPAATFREIVTHRQFAMNGPLKLQLRPRGTVEHDSWRRQVNITLVGPPIAND